MLEIERHVVLVHCGKNGCKGENNEKESEKIRENEDEKEGWHTRDGVSLLTMVSVTIGDRCEW